MDEEVEELLAIIRRLEESDPVPSTSGCTRYDFRKRVIVPDTSAASPADHGEINCNSVLGRRVNKAPTNDDGVKMKNKYQMFKQMLYKKKKRKLDKDKPKSHKGSGKRSKIKTETEPTCNFCKQILNDCIFHKGHPPDSLEEPIALRDNKLNLDSDFADTDDRPQANLREFSIFDLNGHLCPIDNGLIECGVKLYISGYLNSMFCFSPDDNNSVSVKDMGPITHWSLHGFAGGIEICITVSTEFGEYNLLQPSLDYAPIMKSLYEKISITKIVVEFLEKFSYMQPTYADLLKFFGECTIPELGNIKMTEQLLHKHAKFICDQLLNLEAKNRKQHLLTIPCMRELIKIMHIRFDNHKLRASIAYYNRVDKKACKATTTPLVRKTFENLFLNQLDISNKKFVARVNRCGICNICQLTDCGECKPCRRMPKFGGLIRRWTRKPCERKKRCLNIDVEDSEEDSTDEEIDYRDIHHFYGPERRANVNVTIRVKFLGKPVEIDEDRQFYEEVQIEEEKYKIGDFVLIDTLSHNIPSLIGRIVYMWKEITYQKTGFLHVQEFTRSSDTVLGQVGNPRELFLQDICYSGVNLQSVLGKAYVEKIETPNDWFNLGGKDITIDNLEDDGKHYFYKQFYNKSFGRFENLPKDPLPPNDLRIHCFCPSCERQSIRDFKLFPQMVNEKLQLVQGDSVQYIDGKIEFINGNCNDKTELMIKCEDFVYRKGCAIFLEPSSFKFPIRYPNMKNNYKMKRVIIPDIADIKHVNDEIRSQKLSKKMRIISMKIKKWFIKNRRRLKKFGKKKRFKIKFKNNLKSNLPEVESVTTRMNGKNKRIKKKKKSNKKEKRSNKKKKKSNKPETMEVKADKKYKLKTKIKRKNRRNDKPNIELSKADKNTDNIKIGKGSGEIVNKSNNKLPTADKTNDNKNKKSERSAEKKSDKSKNLLQNVDKNVEFKKGDLSERRWSDRLINKLPKAYKTNKTEKVDLSERNKRDTLPTTHEVNKKVNKIKLKKSETGERKRSYGTPTKLPKPNDCDEIKNKTTFKKFKRKGNEVLRILRNNLKNKYQFNGNDIKSKNKNRKRKRNGSNKKKSKIPKLDRSNQSKNKRIQMSEISARRCDRLSNKLLKSDKNLEIKKRNKMKTKLMKTDQGENKIKNNIRHNKINKKKRKKRLMVLNIKLNSRLSKWIRSIMNTENVKRKIIERKESNETKTKLRKTDKIISKTLNTMEPNDKAETKLQKADERYKIKNKYIKRKTNEDKNNDKPMSKLPKAHASDQVINEIKHRKRKASKRKKSDKLKTKELKDAKNDKFKNKIEYKKRDREINSKLKVELPKSDKNTEIKNKGVISPGEKSNKSKNKIKKDQSSIKKKKKKSEDKLPKNDNNIGNKMTQLRERENSDKLPNANKIINKKGEIIVGKKCDIPKNKLPNIDRIYLTKGEAIKKRGKSKNLLPIPKNKLPNIDSIKLKNGETVENSEKLKSILLKADKNIESKVEKRRSDRLSNKLPKADKRHSIKKEQISAKKISDKFETKLLLNAEEKRKKKVIKRTFDSIPKTKLPKVDESIFTEYYRKNINPGKKFDIFSAPFCVGYIREIVYLRRVNRIPAGRDIFLRVNVLLRPEDTIHRFPQHEDLNMVYWTNEVRTVPFISVVGPCELYYIDNIPEKDTFREWLEKDPSRLYFREAYCRFTTEFEPVPTHATTIGRLGKGKGKGKGMSNRNASYAKKPVINARPLKTLDVFAGCGGLSEGLHQAGIAQCKWAIEMEEPAAQAYSLNNIECVMFKEDANDVLHGLINGATHSSAGLRYPLQGEVELMCGGPPCQGFSGMNRFNYREYSNFKNSLIVTYLSFCDYYRPKFFILENVMNFVTFKKGMILKLTLRTLLDIGYQCTFGILQAANYGVPQSRRRLILLAAAPGYVLPLYPDHTNAFFHRKCPLAVTVDDKTFTTNITWIASGPRRSCVIYDALCDLPEIENGGANDVEIEYVSEPKNHYQRLLRSKDSTVPLTDHICKKMSVLNQERISRIPYGGDWRDLPNLPVTLSDGTTCNVLQYRYNDTKSAKKKRGKKKGGRKSKKPPPLRGVCACAEGRPCNPEDRQENTLIPWFLPHTANRNNWAGLYGRIEWYSYFSTTVTDPEPAGKQGRVLHPTENRVISVRECARSQGFPDTYHFAGSIQDKYRQIGNAVPPPLAAAIGRELIKAEENRLNNDTNGRETRLTPMGPFTMAGPSISAGPLTSAGPSTSAGFSVNPTFSDDDDDYLSLEEYVNSNDNYFRGFE